MLKIGEMKVGDKCWFISLGKSKNLSLTRNQYSIISPCSCEPIECTITGISNSGLVQICSVGCNYAPYDYCCLYDSTTDLKSVLFESKEAALAAAKEYLISVKNNFILQATQCIEDIDDILKNF